MEKNDNATKSWVLIIASIASFLTPLMVASIYIALPAIGKEFKINVILLSWIPTSYLLAAAMFLVPFGRIADIYGRKKVFLNGIIIYTVSSLLATIASSPISLITFRVSQGIGGAMIFGTGTAIIASVFPAGEKGKALRINVAAVYAGLSLGPFFGGFLTQNFGWRSIFLINAILGLIIVALTIGKLKGEWAEAKEEKFDILGSIIYCLTLIAIMYGFSLLPSKNGVWLILFGGLGIFLFLRLEEKIKSPIFNVNIFRENPVFTLSNLSALINYTATAAIGFLLSLYLQYIKGLNPQSAGLILVSQPIMQTIFSPFAGRLSDRVEPRIVASIGMALTVIGLFIFIFLNTTTNLSLIIINQMFLGLGFGLFSSPNTNAVMNSVERRFYGVASATLATMRLTGQMLSLGVAMLVFAIFIGKVQITPEYYSVFLKSTKILFAIFAVLCFGGIWTSLARGKVHHN